MKHLLALAILVAAPSLALAESDEPRFIQPERAGVVSTQPALATGYELRASVGNQARTVEAFESARGHNPYATGVLTSPANIRTPG